MEKIKAEAYKLATGNYVPSVKAEAMKAYALMIIAEKLNNTK